MTPSTELNNIYQFFELRLLRNEAAKLNVLLIAYLQQESITSSTHIS